MSESKTATELQADASKLASDTYASASQSVTDAATAVSNSTSEAYESAKKTVNDYVHPEPEPPSTEQIKEDGAKLVNDVSAKVGAAVNSMVDGLEGEEKE